MDVALGSVVVYVDSLLACHGALRGSKCAQPANHDGEDLGKPDEESFRNGNEASKIDTKHTHLAFSAFRQ